jgi:hypothetical protein
MSDRTTNGRKISSIEKYGEKRNVEELKEEG